MLIPRRSRGWRIERKSEREGRERGREGGLDEFIIKFFIFPHGFR